MGLYYKNAPCPGLLLRAVFSEVLYGQACSPWRLLAGGIDYRDVHRIQGHAEVIQGREPCLRWVLDGCPLQCKSNPE